MDAGGASEGLMAGAYRCFRLVRAVTNAGNAPRNAFFPMSL